MCEKYSKVRVAKIEMVRFELEKTWVNFFKFFPCVSKLVKIDCAFVSLFENSLHIALLFDYFTFARDI